MLRSLRNTRRLVAIAVTLAQEDALFILTELRVAPILAWVLMPFRRRQSGLPRGKRLARALERLGPTYIKLGQMLSTRSDLIGEDIAQGLEGLRDRLQPFPTSVARAIVEEEMEKPISEMFTEFSDAVAAASIAQVHKATRKDGKVVAVKILRPGIDRAFEQDIDLFFWVAEIIESRLRQYRRLKPIEVVRTFKESVFFELDLRFEAAAGTELAQNLRRHEEGFRVPSIDWNHTSRRILTTDWVNGIPLSDVAAIRAAGHDTDTILTKAARSVFAQVFYDGFFHADLHPGNLFVDEKGDLVAVDFGIMGRLDWKSRVFMAQILRGFIEQDYRHVAQMHFDAGYVPAGKSIEAFTQACMAVAQPIMGKPVNEISAGNLLGQMFKIAAEFEMETQPQLLLLQKTMVLTEGVGRMLNPRLNTWQLAEPLIKEWATTQFGLFGKCKEASREARDIAAKFPEILRRVELALGNWGDPQGVRLHPSSVEAINHARFHMQRSWLRLGWSACVIAGLLLGFSVLK